MKSFRDWKIENILKESIVNQDEFVGIVKNYFANNNINEAVETSRYSIEVNYRTTPKETLEGFAKLCLGYVSAALKKQGYHTKHVYDQKPLRLMVSTRNWDDGEWTGVVTWHPEHNCFVISKGHYNKSRKSVNINQSHKCSGESAAEIVKDIHNLMSHLKNQPNKHVEKLKPVPLKRGPKQ